MSSKARVAASDVSSNDDLERAKDLLIPASASQSTVDNNRRIYQSEMAPDVKSPKLSVAEGQAIPPYQYESAMQGYIPFRDDPIDIQVANDLNQRDDLDRILRIFAREKPGIYLLGHQQVRVTMDRAQRVHVRVGGGTCSLDEFIARNLDKAERKRYSTPGKRNQQSRQ